MQMHLKVNVFFWNANAFTKKSKKSFHANALLRTDSRWAMTAPN